MKKKLISVLALSLLSLSACNVNTDSSAGQSTTPPASTTDTTGTVSDTDTATSTATATATSSTSSSDSTVYSVAITNKEDLTAEWHVLDANRNLELDISPRGNLLDLFAEGILKVESSAPEVVAANNRTLTAVSAGTAVITVTYGNVSDTVEITVLAALTIKDKYGVNHLGTAEDPLDNEDAVKIGLWCKENNVNQTAEVLYVKGKVVSFYHAPGARDDGAVSYYLEPAEDGGTRFEVYCATPEDAEKTIGATDIWIGAVATAYGNICYYANGNQPEFAQGTAKLILPVEGTPPAPQQILEKTFAEALAMGGELADGDSTYDYVKFSAYVVKKDGNNYFLNGEKSVAEDKSMIELYNISDAEMAAKLLNGAKVTVTMQLKNYHGQVENNGKPKELVLDSEGEPWNIKYIEKNVAGALEVIAALEDGATTEEYYKVIGKVVAVTTEYNAQYGNISFTMADAVDATDVLTVFRLTCSEEESKLIVAGADIAVGGKLQKYVKNETVTPELTSGKLLSSEPAIEELDVAGALEVIAALEDSATTDAQYKISGRIIEVTTAFNSQYNNISFTIGDDQGNVLTVFRLATTEEESAKIVADNDVVILGKLQKYVKNGVTTPEIVNGSIDSLVENTYVGATVQEALAVIDALENSAITDAQYKVSGTVGSITSDYNAQYGNISFTISDGEGNVLTAFRLSISAEAAKKLVVGSEVTVVGKLQKYVKNDVVTPEIVSGKVLSVKEGAEKPEAVDLDKEGTVKTPAEVIAAADAAKTEMVRVTGVAENLYSAKYGNFYIVDPETGAAAIVYGGYTDIEYTKLNDAYTADKTDKTVVGESIIGKVVTVVGLLGSYKGVGQVVDAKVFLSEETPTVNSVSVADGIVNGEVSLSKTENFVYGEEITVTATPADGFELEKVIATEASGKETDITASLKFNVSVKVIISATFKEVQQGETPAALPSFTVADVTPSAYVNGYDKSFTATVDGVQFRFDGLNNGQSSSNWEEWRFGHKTNANTVVIQTLNAVQAAVGSIEFLLGGYTSNGLTSAKAYVSSDGTEWTEACDFAANLAADTAVKIDLGDKGGANLFFKIEIVLTAIGGSSNGVNRFKGLNFLAPAE